MNVSGPFHHVFAYLSCPLSLTTKSADRQVPRRHFSFAAPNPSRALSPRSRRPVDDLRDTLDLLSATTTIRVLGQIIESLIASDHRDREHPIPTPRRGRGSADHRFSGNFATDIGTSLRPVFAQRSHTDG